MSTYNKVTITKVITHCTQCPYSHQEKLYNSNSIFTKYKLYCGKLMKWIHKETDGEEYALIGSECPFYK